jgi:hypothetical protein
MAQPKTMNEQVARDAVLVRAIETADTGREILSDDDRMYASRSARELAQWQAADSKSPVTLDHFLQQRSEQILKRLAERIPAFSSFLRRRPLLPTLMAVLPVLGLLAGAGLDRIADPHRVDLLSAPLLLIIGWNLLVYLILLIWSLIPSKNTGRAGPRLLQRLSVGKASLPRKLPGVLAAALVQFMHEWSQLSAPLSRVRLARALHLAAACFALGAILSLYARGLLTQYAAGWESTFLDARQVHAILSVLFAPALMLFPVDGFSVADIEALRFTGTPSSAGGARWVHLYAATLCIFVVMPRLLFGAFAHWRTRRLERRFPLDLGSPYFLALASHLGTGGPAILRVFPYSFTVDPERDKGLAALAQAALGDHARLMLRPASPYGEEPHEVLRDEMLADPDVAVNAALFNLAATPEKENQGAFLDFLMRQCPRGVAVLVDESAFVERSAGQPGADARLEERKALWRQFCSFHRTTAQFVDLHHPNKHALDLGAGLTSTAVQ